MSDNTAKLIAEIKRIKSRYERAAEGGKRAWPVSIKERINRLQSLGVSAQSMADRTGIPYATIMSWRYAGRAKQTNGFHEVKVGVSTSSPVSVALPAGVTANLRVRTPSGFVIEGLCETGVVALVGRLQQGDTHAS